MIDTYHSFETPEGVELNLNIAGPAVRTYAFLVDVGIRTAIQIALATVLAILGKIGLAAMLVAYFLLEWFYPVFFEVFQYGQTPGKKMMGIRVVMDNGTPVDWPSSVIRNLLRVADFLPFAYIIGITIMILNGKFQRLGDLASGTMVIYSDSRLNIPEIPAATPKNFPIILSLEEQQSIIGLAERSSNLSKERVAELANILGDVIKQENEDAVKELLQVANGLVGAK